MTTPPRPARTHVWNGGTVPAWLDLHQYWFDNNQLVVATPDGHAHPQPGWWLIGWSNGVVTAASPWTGQHVYGPDGIAARLAEAERQLRLIRRLRDDQAAHGVRWIADALDHILNAQEQP